MDNALFDNLMQEMQNFNQQLQNNRMRYTNCYGSLGNSVNCYSY